MRADDSEPPSPDCAHSYLFPHEQLLQHPVPSHLTGKVRDGGIPNPADVGTPAAFEEARDLIEGVLFDWLTQFEERTGAELEGPPQHHLGAAANGSPSG
jgi:hypothetical protein